MICIDSNIWIYYLSSKAPEHKAVAEVVRNVLLEEEVLVNSVIILEVAHYFRLLPKERLLKMVNYMTGLQNLILIELDIPLIEDSVKILAEYAKAGLGARDATILASMRRAGLKRIMTHDSIFKEIKNIDVIDPLE